MTAKVIDKGNNDEILTLKIPTSLIPPVLCLLCDGKDARKKKEED